MSDDAYATCHDCGTGFELTAERYIICPSCKVIQSGSKCILCNGRTEAHHGLFTGHCTKCGMGYSIMLPEDKLA